MNDSNSEKMSGKQGGFGKSIKEMLNKQHQPFSIKDLSAKKAVLYAAAAACIMGIVALGALVLMSHSYDKGFSELYFDNPDSLPHVIYVGRGLNFSFSLVSHENAPFTYIFNVTLDGSPVKAGVLRLNPQERQTVNVTLIPNASSLAHFRTSCLSQFRTEEDGSGIPVQLNVSQAPESPRTSVSSEPTFLKNQSQNFGEAVVVGSLDSVKPGNSDDISSFGYILQKEQYSTTEENGRKYLDCNLTEDEYRYKFMNISVGVLSQNDQLNADSDRHTAAGAQHSYEIHFRAIAIENIPERFLGS